MQELSSRLREYMEQRGWSEEQLALKAGVSQATVSRALTREGKRIGPAQKKLFKYAKLIAHKSSRELREKGRLISAVERIWSQSDHHAEAVTKIIDALAALSGQRAEEESRH